MAVSPWTLVLMAWIDGYEKRKEHQRCKDISPLANIEEETENADSKMTEAEILSVRNLPKLPLRKPSLLSVEEEHFRDQHKYMLSIIWGMSLLCGLCSEQALDQSKNPPCSLTRRLSSPVEIVSILLTQPVPAILSMFPCAMMAFYRTPPLSDNHRIRTILILSIFYIMTILPSLLAELMDTGSNLSILIMLKFSLASIHIIFEPVVILFMRPDLQAALRTICTREK